MSKAKGHKPAKLIVGMFTNRLGLFEEALKVLEKKYGPVDYKSPLLPFDKTDYYKEEFGKDLKRKFYSFKKLIEAEDLPKVKIFANNLEKKLSEEGNRSINLDPGYLTPAKLVLATTKDYQHRIYYGKGIYGEVTLRYKKKSFIPWEWTYPDYRTEEYIEIFNHIRKIYMEQLK
ncbi:DUF4416 family protein [bacterium]|nr:DUF4416 family protein [bacterium]MCG2676357.1 DUF4416 family protein [bacterium]MCG2677908.1 DUF4416 family protein [bacterium]